MRRADVRGDFAIRLVPLAIVHPHSTRRIRLWTEAFSEVDGKACSDVAEVELLEAGRIQTLDVLLVEREITDALRHPRVAFRASESGKAGISRYKADAFLVLDESSYLLKRRRTSSATEELVDGKVVFAVRPVLTGAGPPSVGGEHVARRRAEVEGGEGGQEGLEPLLDGYGGEAVPPLLHDVGEGGSKEESVEGIGEGVKAAILPLAEGSGGELEVATDDSVTSSGSFMALSGVGSGTGLDGRHVVGRDLVGESCN